MADQCEWNPVAGRAAYSDELGHGSATWSIGAGDRNIHVCDDCAGLAAFKRYRKRVRIRACACGSDDPASARFGHPHLRWCGEHPDRQPQKAQ